MFFYDLTIYFDDEVEEQFSKDNQERENGNVSRDNAIVIDLLKNTAHYNKAEADSKTLLVSEIKNDHMDLSVCCKNLMGPKDISDYIEAVQIGCKDWKLQEITIKSYECMLKNGYWNHYFADDEDTSMGKPCRDIIRAMDRKKVTEAITPDEKLSSSEIKKEAETLSSHALTEELDRILSARVKRTFMGHPVHYLIETDDYEFEKAALQTLMEALYLKKRVVSHKCFSVNLGSTSNSPDEADYKLAEPGCFIVRMPRDRDESQPLPADVLRDIERTAKLMKKYQNRVLTIFLLPQHCNRIKGLLYENTQECTFIEITQDKLEQDQAAAYLSQKAKERHVKADESLCLNLGRKAQCYTVSELDDYFETWLSGYMKKNVFPEYAHLGSAVKEVEKEQPIGDAYKELNNMIGLTEAKQVINEALEYFKAQKLFRDKGFQENYPAMHMVFTGNPGTAKTTVARLFAQILKDNDILTEGKLYEVGRTDLVDRYVGWTAKRVQEVFDKARGSVLFIDEAYSLMDGQRGKFGDEAINTIVQEMENHREDMVVILAGYPNEMARMLDHNPGLRSRVAYHISFPDYSAEELYEIAELKAEENGMRLGPDAEEVLLPMFEEAREDRNFGNGRYVRNLIENARRKQAGRLLHMGYEDVTVETATTLEVSDFEDVHTPAEKKKTPIGF